MTHARRFLKHRLRRGGCDHAAVSEFVAPVLAIGLFEQIAAALMVAA